MLKDRYNIQLVKTLAAPRSKLQRPHKVYVLLMSNVCCKNSPGRKCEASNFVKALEVPKDHAHLIL